MIRVAIFNGANFVTALQFRPEAPDSELQAFAELTGGDRFERLAFNEYMEPDGTRVVVEAPFPSWIWNEDLGNWEAPVAPPETTEVPIQWDEATQSWVEVPAEK